MKKGELIFSDTVSVIGLGTIGIGWVAQFIAAGLKVQAFDSDLQKREELPERTVCMLQACGLSASIGLLSVHTTLQDAVSGAGFVQENAPECRDIKSELFAALDVTVDPCAVIASSTSGLSLSDLQRGLSHPGRFIVGHPFNPVPLIPLIEVVPGGVTTQQSIESTASFYRALGKVVLVLRKEAPGHLVNRLQAALWREAVACVESGLASVAEVDTAVVNCLGPRWAATGPHMTFHLGGGDGGLRNFIQHFGTGIEARWQSFSTPKLNELVEILMAGIEEEAQGADLNALIVSRDKKLRTIFQALKESS